MIHKLLSRLGIKLFILLTAVITLSIAPLAYTSLKAINRYGKEVSVVNEQQIRSQAFSYLKKITRERANRYQAFFDRIGASAGMLGSHASTIYSDINFFSNNPLYQNHYNIQRQNGFWANSISDPVISVYWGSPELGVDARAELDALTHMMPLFTRVLDENPEVLASHVITVSGIGQYCTYREKNKEMALNLPPLSVFDLRDGEPVTIFTQSTDVSGGVRWTDVYKDDASEGLALTASAPIYDSSGLFRGVTGIDVPLSTVVEDILNIDVLDPENTILFAFLTDNDGRLIAFPETYYKRFGMTFDPNQFTDSSDSLKLNLKDSRKSEVREFAAMIASGQETFSQLDTEDGSLFIATSRLPNLDWVFGLVVRQSDMFASVEKSRTSLEKTIRTMELNGLLLSVMTILSALVIVFLSVKYLVMPLRTLAVATQKVAGGDLSVRCPVTTTDETGVLASSFNTMVERLKQAQERQQQYADSLELEVEQRNRELVEKKDELEVTIDLLEKEVERRQIISEALRNSQQQYYETLDANKAGIYIITDGVFNYVNQSLADLLHTSPQELIGMSPLDFVSEEDRDPVAENMEKRFQGDEISPYRVKCVAVDGSTFYGEVWGKITTWEKRKALVGTVTDVSYIQRNEEKIRAQDIQLRKSLEEKEILLKEIYHRTKNNMLVIISMLELQVQDIDDERIVSIFRDTEHRIRAMALVHEKLYQSQDLSEIDLGSYLEEVVHSLVGNMVLAGKIHLNIEVVPTPINIDYAVPLGLVVNEIVTNSVKHAFPGTRTGTLSLRLTRDQGTKIRLEISDDGVGLPESVTIHESGSFGMQLVNSLIKVQLRGEVSVDRRGGTHFLIAFDEPVNATRV
jgi:PAS domain S-box-containing protein